MNKSEYLSSLVPRLRAWRVAFEDVEDEQAEEFRRISAEVDSLLLDYQRIGAEGWRRERRQLELLCDRLEELVESSQSQKGRAV